MIFSPNNWEDIHRYFKGTFVKFKECGDDLFLITHVDQEKVTGKHESDPEGFTIYLDEATPYEVDYILPHKSYFQFSDKAVQLYRSPAKQYYRGLCASNTNLCYMSHATVPMMKSLDISFTTLKAFVAKQAFRSLTEAIESKDFSVVLSSRMMYHKASKQIFLDQIPIARVNNGKRIIYMIHPIFEDEVMDILKHSGEDKKFTMMLAPKVDAPVVPKISDMEESEWL